MLKYKKNYQNGDFVQVLIEKRLSRNHQKIRAQTYKCKPFKVLCARPLFFYSLDIITSYRL